MNSLSFLQRTIKNHHQSSTLYIGISSDAIGLQKYKIYHFVVLQVYAMWQTWRTHNRNVTSPTISFVELLLPPITFLVLYFNSCLNPIIYALLSENFRKYLRELCCSHLLVLIPGCLRDRFRHRSHHHHQQLHQHMNAMYVFVDGRRLSIGQNTLVSSRS